MDVKHAMPTVGDEIRRRRRAVYWSIRKLSDVTGITPETLGRIELGRQKPHKSTLELINVALDKREREVFGMKTVLAQRERYERRNNRK